MNDTDRSESVSHDFHYSSVPTVAEEVLVDADQARQGLPHAAASWVRRGGKVAVATAFLTGVAGAAAALPSAAADFGQSDAPVGNDDSSTSPAPSGAGDETVVTTPPLGIGRDGDERSTARRPSAPQAQLQTQSPVRRPPAVTAGTVVTGLRPMTSVPAPVKRRTVPAPAQKQATQKQATPAPIPVPKQQTPTPKQAAPKQATPAPAPVPVQPPAAPKATAAEIFAAELQVKISKVVAEDAATRAQQALSLARNASADANEKVSAANAASTAKAEADASAAITKANEAASVAQAAHYDAETKIRAYEIAKTALAALTQTAVPVALPANPTVADVAIANARAAIEESTATAAAARTAALKANEKIQAARAQPTNLELAEAATEASLVAEGKAQIARAAELRAEDAVGNARNLTTA